MEGAISPALHEEFAKRVEAEDARQNARIAELETGLREVRALNASIERLATSMENMAREQERQGERLEALEGRDGELWRKAVWLVVSTVIGAILGYVIHGIGL